MSDYIINFTDPLKGSFVIRPYTSNGPKFPTTSELNSTSISASSTLLLYGKGHAEYGERTNENILNLLENFSGATEPAIKVAGMLWHKEVLYYRDTGTVADFYVAGEGSPQWSIITISGTGAVPVSGSDGDYWYDNSGSPIANVLYQYSADERNIDAWLVREFSEDSGAPTSDPVKEMQIYDGTDWDILPDLTAVNALLSGDYLKLDTSNGPLTGDLEISKTSPNLTLTGSDPDIILTGSDPTIRFNGGTAFQVAGNDGANVLEFRIGAALGTNTHFVIDNANDYLTHGNNLSAAAYSGNISGVDEALVNVRYVDDLVAGTILGDTFINGGTFAIVGSPASGTLTMPYSTGSPGGALVVTGFDSDQIPFVAGAVGGTEPAATVDEGLTKAAPLNDPTFTGTVTVPSIGGGDAATTAANKGYVDSVVTTASSSIPEALRSVQVGGSAAFNLPFTYTAGHNRLLVFKNGVKQYKDVQASSVATFSPSLTAAQILNGLDTYIITGVNVGADTWTISGDHSAEFTAGDTFEVTGNGGGGDGGYIVASAVGVGSPVTATDIVVAGSPGIVSADASGTLGIDYEFELTVDGVTNTITPVNLIGVGNTVDDLITEMQSAIDLVFGAGVAAVYLFDGDIKVDSLSISGGSPMPTISMANGSVPTSDLFDTVNLVEDGFTGSFSSAPAVSFGYYESDGAGVADSGSPAQFIEFNVTTLVSDIIEFLKV